MTGDDSGTAKPSSDSDKLPMTDRPPRDVPVFSCLVYVSKHADGLHARVANLAEISATGRSEREVLGEIVRAFKQHVNDHLAKEGQIPWLDPVLPLAAQEQKRLIPVHL